MTDLQPFKHGEEGSHYFCDAHNHLYFDKKKKTIARSLMPLCCGCHPSKKCKYKNRRPDR